ncbi:MAG TPA: hypothetical protein VFG33_00005, partial [Kribbella sp.]|uniref:hypothetical protein n=1 Tax=Kribbella sp. TaxID=1871183 RepID=UPI002D769BDD
LPLVGLALLGRLLLLGLALVGLALLLGAPSLLGMPLLVGLCWLVRLLAPLSGLRSRVELSRLVGGLLLVGPLLRLPPLVRRLLVQPGLIRLLLALGPPRPRLLGPERLGARSIGVRFVTLSGRRRLLLGGRGRLPAVEPAAGGRLRPLTLFLLVRTPRRHRHLMGRVALGGLRRRVTVVGRP